MILRNLIFLSCIILVISSNKFTEKHSEEEKEGVKTSDESTCEKDGCEHLKGVNVENSELQDKDGQREESNNQQTSDKLPKESEDQLIESKDVIQTEEHIDNNKLKENGKVVEKVQNETTEETNKEQVQDSNKNDEDFDESSSDDEDVAEFEKRIAEEQERRKLNLDELKLVQLDGVEVGHVKHIQLKSNGPKYRLITRAMKPLLFEIPNFLTREECDHIIGLAVESGLSTSIAGFDPKTFDGDLRQALIDKKEEDVKTGKSLATLNKSYHTQVFRWWDVDGDGKISSDEMKKTLKRFYLVYLNQEEMEEMFHAIGSDAYDDHDITKEELEEKIDLGQMHVYMNFLRQKHPKHRSRYSDQAWLPQNKKADPILRDLHERIINLTKLPRKVVQGGEALQVVRYGVHGHYHAHYDSSPNKGDGNPCCHQVPDNAKCNLCRFITILYYLNDVEEGGETAFLTANNATHNEEEMKRTNSYNLAQNCYKSTLVVPPKQGTVIMWYNHFIDEKTGMLGPRDERSLHGGCPVYKGFKWIANNWITAPTYDGAHIMSKYYHLMEND